MKSIKPGRGPSRLSTVSGIGTTLFGIFWCVGAGALGAWFLIPFGLIFVGIALYTTLYHHHNATAEDRYSLVDIVDESEEGDPLNEKYGKKQDPKNEIPGTCASFCPFCGSKVEGSFDFCPKCGGKLPD